MNRTCSTIAILTALSVSTLTVGKERPKPLTGTRILDRMEVVFDTSPIRLASTLAAGVEDPRSSITFVLDPSLTIAQSVFEVSDGFATDTVVTDLRSLTEVRDYLVRSGQAYSLINLVAHGAAQTGMRVPVTPGGPDAHVQTLSATAQDPGLDGRISDDTVVRLYSCTIGADRAFLTALAEFFATRNLRPTVQALDDFIEFSDAEEPKVAVREGLAVVAPTRNLARRAIERQASRAGVDLPHAWQRHLDTRPVVLTVEAAQDRNPADAAASSKLIQDELLRMRAATADFSWDWSDGLLTGTAVVGVVHLDPGPRRNTLSDPDGAEWIASR